MLAIVALFCGLISPILCRLEITSVPTSPCALVLENPHWDAETNSLYFADVFGKLLVRYSYEENKIYPTSVNGLDLAGFFIPVEGRRNQYLVGANESAVIVEWDGRSSTATAVCTLFSTPAGINSAAVGPTGDIYVGSYGPKFCAENPDFSLYDYTSNGCLITVSDDLVTTVGIAIDIARGVLYQLDGCTQAITAFRWNPFTGRLSKGHFVMKMHFPEHVAPVGLAIDSNGDLYSGLYNGSAVIKIDPIAGCIVQTVDLPTPYIAAPTFGGPNLDTLFVTTANLPVDFFTGQIGAPLREPPAGNLFMIRGLCEKGTPSYRVRLPASC